MLIISRLETPQNSHKNTHNCINFQGKKRITNRLIIYFQPQLLITNQLQK